MAEMANEEAEAAERAGTPAAARKVLRKTTAVFR